MEPENEHQEETVVVRGFGVGTIFDVSQTEGPPLPTPPRGEVISGASDVGMRLFVDLIDFLQEHRVSFIREHLPSAYGSFDPLGRRVTLARDLDGDQATKTLAHETAHVVAGHTPRMSSRDVETVAESAAYVVLHHYGIDRSGYSFP